jgi:hypothetical protein
VHAVVAEKHTALAEEEMELASDFLSRMKKDADKIEPRDLSTALRNLDVGSGIHSDKAIALRDRLPGATAPSRSFNDIVAALQAKNIRIEVEVKPEPAEEPERPAIEGTGEEVKE